MVTFASRLSFSGSVFGSATSTGLPEHSIVFRPCPHTCVMDMMYTCVGRKLCSSHVLAPEVFPIDESGAISGAVRRRLNLAPVAPWAPFQFFRTVTIRRRGRGSRAGTNSSRGTCIHMEKILFSVRRVENYGMSNTTRQRLAQELNQPGPAQYQQLLTLTCPRRRQDPD